MNYKHWLMTCVAFIILEILPPPTHFFFVCMAFGALAASIASLFSSISWLPWAVFAITTVALVPVLIPLARFLFTPKAHASNSDEVLGKKALVLEPISPERAGKVKVGSEEWRAINDEGRIEKDTWVVVEKIEGASVRVKK